MLCVTPPCFSPSTILPLKRSRLHQGGFPPTEIRSAPFLDLNCLCLTVFLTLAKSLRLPFLYALFSDNLVFTACHLHTGVRAYFFIGLYHPYRFVFLGLPLSLSLPSHWSLPSYQILPSGWFLPSHWSLPSLFSLITA